MTLFTTLLVLIAERLFAGRALAARSPAGSAVSPGKALFPAHYPTDDGRGGGGRVYYSAPAAGAAV